MQNIKNMNGVLSSAMIALSKTVNRVDGDGMAEVDIKDAIMLQECASVIARSSAGELLTAMKGMKAVREA